MANVYNWDNFQIAQTGMDDTTTAISGDRQFSRKMSNFGDLNFRGASGALVQGNDYTKTALGFSAKQDWSDTVPVLQDAELNDNPLLVNSSLKYLRDDQFVRMGMSMGGNVISPATSVVNAQINEPDADVMDTKAVDAAGTTGATKEFLNFPTEGWHSFGGKYDKEEPYQG